MSQQILVPAHSIVELELGRSPPPAEHHRDFGTVNTGLTASCGSGTLDFTTTATAPITFDPGAQTFGTVNVNVGSSAYWFNIAPGLTATALNATAPFTLALTELDTYAITNAFTWTGGSSSAQSAVICRNCAGTASVTTISSAATNTATWLAIRGLHFPAAARLQPQIPSILAAIQE